MNAPAGGGPAKVRRWRTPLLLVGWLLLHFLTRDYHAQRLPLAEHHNYERSYGFALSLAAGRNFDDIVLADTPASRPIREFLELRRPAVSSAEWSEFLNESASADDDVTWGIWRQLATTRVLDLRLTGWLWRIFGIRWDVVYHCYALFSVGVALCVFWTARRLSGSTLAGSISLVLFTASPLESHLAAWSIRDVSPLWFTAFGFCFLYCVVDRLTQPRWWLAGCCVLGVLSVIGIGWRPDALLLIPCLGGALVAQSALWRKGWLTTATGWLLFAGGAAGGLATINALTPAGAMPASMGFHMAYYADFTRCNLWGVENTFQTQRCDMQTMFTARQYAATADPAGPPLVYLSAEYAGICREMCLRQFHYHAFEFVFQFPSIYWRVLNGLRAPEAFATVNFWQQSEYRPPPVRWLFQFVLEPLARISPPLFLLGAIATILCGPRRWPAAVLTGFTLFYTVILLVVLPEQKHVGPIVFPLCTLAGIGWWYVVSLVQPTVRASVVAGFRAGCWRRPMGLAALLAAFWGLASGAAYYVGRHERQALLTEIDAVAPKSIDATDYLRGEHTFVAHFEPGNKNDQCGFFLTVEGGSQPATLSCRHQRFPHDWGWPRQLTTRHEIARGVRQTFFVTCLQGWEFSDPRPYACFATIEGDAKLTGCRRVDLRDWHHLPVSTLYREGESRSGSPRGHEPTSSFTYTTVNVVRQASVDPREQSRNERAAYAGRAGSVAWGPPLAHLMFYESATGQWVIANSNGHAFQLRRVNYWSPRVQPRDLRTGDFNGDGIRDVICRDSRGKWWQVRSDGGLVMYFAMTDWTNGKALTNIVAGDFNGDGLSDLAAHDAQAGQWIVGLSDGRQLIGTSWYAGTLASDVQVFAGDVNGDGRDDLLQFEPSAARWNVLLSNGKQFAPAKEISFDPTCDWSLPVVADFDGDGQTDVAAFDRKARRWYSVTKLNEEAQRVSSPAWPADFQPDTIRAADLNGDGRADLVACDESHRRVGIMISDENGWSVPVVADLPPGTSEFWTSDFDGDGRDDVAVQTTPTGELWVGTFSANQITFTKWGDLHSENALRDGQVLRFWLGLRANHNRVR